MNKHVHAFAVIAAVVCVFSLSGCSQGVAAYYLQSGLEYSLDNGSVRAVVVNNQSDNTIESATVQMDFHLRNGDVLTKKQTADCIDKKSSWRYELDPPMKDVVRVEIAVTGANGHGKLSLQVPPMPATGAANRDSPPAVTMNDSSDYYQMAQLIGHWSGLPQSGYIKFSSSGEVELLQGRTIMKGTYVISRSILTLSLTELQERGKTAEVLPKGKRATMTFKVVSLTPLVLELDGRRENFVGVTSTHDNREGVESVSSEPHGGSLGARLSRVFLVPLTTGWRDIHSDYDYSTSLYDALKDGKSFIAVVQTEDGQTIRVPASFTTSHIHALFHPNLLEEPSFKNVEEFWRTVGPVRFWIELAPKGEKKGQPISSIVTIPGSAFRLE